MSYGRPFIPFPTIEWLDVHDERTRAREKLRSVSDEALLREIHAVCGDGVWVGYDAYRAIASRVPLFWVAWPLLYLFPIPTIGRWTYQALARARTCSPGTPLSVRQAFRRSTGRSVNLRHPDRRCAGARQRLGRCCQDPRRLATRFLPAF